MLCFANSNRAASIVRPHSIDVSELSTDVERNYSGVEPAIVDVTIAPAEFYEAMIKTLLVTFVDRADLAVISSACFLRFENR
jgi:hypothetical protein